MEDLKRELLRHTLATLSYRGGKTLRGAPVGFAEFRITEGSRTPGQILTHIGDLLDWALSLAQGKQRWRDAAPHGGSARAGGEPLRGVDRRGAPRPGTGRAGQRVRLKA